MEVEKALKIISKGDPLDVHDLVRSLEAITRNPAQLSSGDVLNLYLKLLDRVFSEEVTKGGNEISTPFATTTTGSGGNSGNSNSANNQNIWIKGNLGGWLRVFIQQNINSGSNNTLGGDIQAISAFVQRQNIAVNNASLPAGTKLIQQLFPFYPLMRLFDDFQTQLQWNVNFLPYKLSALLTNRTSHLVIDAYPAHLLCSELQRFLKINNEKMTVVLDSFQYFLFAMVRYATMSSQYMSKPVQTVSSGGYTPPISPSEQLIARGITAWTNNIPYLSLLQQYIQDFLISDADSLKHAQGRHTLFLLILESWMDVEIVQRYDYSQTLQMQKILAGDFIGLQQLVMGSNANMASDYGHRFSNSTDGMSTTASSSSFVTPHPTKPIVLSPNGLSSAASASSASLKWTVGMQQGIYLYLYTLLNHVSNMHEDLKRLAHTAIDVTSFPSHTNFTASNSTTINIGASNVGSGTNASTLNSMTNMNNNVTVALSVHPRAHAQPVLIRTWQQLQRQSSLTTSSGTNATNTVNAMNKFASPATAGMSHARYLELRQLFQQVHLVQLPLYSMLTAIFTRCEQMAAFDREVLALAVENWVLWLQPWKYKKGFLPESDPEASRSAMRLYIAHNLHFYTTLLVVFLRVMTKVNLTASSEGQKNLLLLGRVLDVFSLEVMETIRHLSHGFVAWLEKALPHSHHHAHHHAHHHNPHHHTSHANYSHNKVRFDASSSNANKVAWQTPSRQSSGTNSSHHKQVLFSVTNEEIKLIKQHHAQCYPDEAIWALPDYGVTLLDDHLYESMYTIYYRNIFTATDGAGRDVAGRRDAGDMLFGDFASQAGKALQTFVSDIFGLEQPSNVVFRGLDSLLDAGKVSATTIAPENPSFFSTRNHNNNDTEGRSAVSSTNSSTTTITTTTSVVTVAPPLTTAQAIRQRIALMVPRLTQTKHREDSQTPSALLSSSAVPQLSGLSSIFNISPIKSNILNNSNIKEPVVPEKMALIMAAGMTATRVSPVTVQVCLDLYVQHLLDQEMDTNDNNNGNNSNSSMVKPKKHFATANLALLAQDDAAAMRFFRQSQDPLDLPVCSHECAFLVHILVAWSKMCNKSQSLPLQPRFLRVSWLRLWEMKRLATYCQRRLRFCEKELATMSAHHDEDTNNRSIYVTENNDAGKLSDMDALKEEIGLLRVLLGQVLPPTNWPLFFRSLYRVNLRHLASYRVFGSLLLCMLFVAARIGMWSDFVCSLLAIPLLWLIVKGSFPEYIIH